jgi:hypothetical protein
MPPSMLTGFDFLLEAAALASVAAPFPCSASPEPSKASWSDISGGNSVRRRRSHAVLLRSPSAVRVRRSRAARFSPRKECEDFVIHFPVMLVTVCERNQNLAFCTEYLSPSALICSIFLFLKRVVANSRIDFDFHISSRRCSSSALVRADRRPPAVRTFDSFPARVVNNLTCSKSTDTFSGDWASS